MRVKYRTQEGETNLISEEFIRYTKDPDYVRMKAGDHHVITYNDVYKHLDYSVRSFRSFLKYELDKSHEYYNTLEELVESKDAGNLSIALEIVKTI